MMSECFPAPKQGSLATYRKASTTVNIMVIRVKSDATNF